VNGGVERAPGGDFELEPVELPPIRELLPTGPQFVFGMANDEIGYIIPKSEWDRQPPYLYDSTKPVYGEVNSVGPETAPILHRAFTELAAELGAPRVVFADDFRGPLEPGWSWVREDPAAWRATDRGLEIRVQPGNMWGGSNNARNLLKREMPDPALGAVDVTVIVTNRPTMQYEQVDLVWYYDDSNMVKIGHELVDGKLSLVMGREQRDATRTITIRPLEPGPIELRLTAEGDRIRGHYRPVGQTVWLLAGECDLPVAGQPHVTIQCYQGPADVERWARLSDFRIRQAKN
jgi:regulation of enolase protein 1 (concanavalin A-like superfamily)